MCVCVSVCVCVCVCVCGKDTEHTGFLISVGLASGVREGTQKLGSLGFDFTSSLELDAAEL